jgi:tRNA (cmo5U34)-methyltransferase
MTDQEPRDKAEERDRLFMNPERQLVDFAFDAEVAAVFPDMIRRSVPGYETVIPLTGLLAARHVAGATASHAAAPHAITPNATASDAPRTIYDLGCSLGATTLAVLRQLGDAPARIVAVDNSAAMIEQARAAIADPRVAFRLADVRELDFEPATVVLLNYVLQFIRPADRLALLTRIRAALAPGGLLIVSGKIRFDDPEEQQFYEAAHLDFKRANGYRELEISGKRNALERVMIVDTEAQHRRYFSDAGFSTVRKWYQCLNWASFLATP